MHYCFALLPSALLQEASLWSPWIRDFSASCVLDLVSYWTSLVTQRSIEVTLNKRSVQLCNNESNVSQSGIRVVKNDWLLEIQSFLG